MIAIPKNVSKSFGVHNQGAAEIPVTPGAFLKVAAGECVALVAASGAGTSTLMRMVCGSYLTLSGRIIVGDRDMASAAIVQAEKLLTRLNIPGSSARQHFRAAQARGVAIIRIFHNHAARDEICDSQFDVTRFAPGPTA